MSTYIEFPAQLAKLDKMAIAMAKAPEPAFEEADEAYVMALQAQGGVFGEVGGEATVYNKVISAALLRGYGFVSVRRAVYVHGQGNRMDASQFLAAGERRLRDSLDRLTVAVGEVGHVSSPDQLRRSVYSHLGATQSALGRAVLVRQAMAGVFDGGSVSYEMIRQQYWFGREMAQGNLRHGDNMYWLANNAGYGLRAERLNGRPSHMAPWLGRMARGLQTADRGEYLPVCRTVARALHESRTHDAALRAVLHHRTC